MEDVKIATLCDMLFLRTFFSGVLAMSSSFITSGCGPKAEFDDHTSSGVPESRFELFVLGRAQDGGVPHLGCTEDFCNQARKTGAAEYPASLGLHDRESGGLVLFDATPAIEPQITLLHELVEAPTSSPGRR